MGKIVVHGLTNCDSVRKALKWLDANEVEHGFHDLRSDGVTLKMLERWAADAGWHSLLNKRSATFRQLDEMDKTVQDRDTAFALMVQHPTLIKRPVLEKDDRVLVGFNQSEWENALS